MMDKQNQPVSEDLVEQVKQRLEALIGTELISLIRPVIEQEARKQERERIIDILYSEFPKFIDKQNKYSNGWNDCRVSILDIISRINRQSLSGEKGE